MRVANGRFSLFSLRGEWLLPIFAGEGFWSNSVTRGMFCAKSALQSATAMDATLQ
jgi:hypothetical protein